MTETLIASSVLIAGICLLRLLMKGRISPQIQYGMWVIVAFRLVVPWFYPLFGWFKKIKSSFSVMNAAQAIRDMAASRPGMEPLLNNLAIGRVSRYSDPLTTAEKAAGIHWQLIILVVWVMGAVLLFCWMMWSNITFSRRIYMQRERYKGNTYGATKLPVYCVRGLSTPCFIMYMGEGAIYLPRDMDADGDGAREKMRHILIHEDCHALHGDHLWSILRCALLCYYWINPLVWAAAFLSKRDCELACDAAAVRRLGEEQRISYGRTLIALTAQSRGLSGLLNVSSDMWNGKRAIRERIMVLARHPRTTGTAALLFTFAMLGLAVCTYTGQREQEDIAEAFSSREGGVLDVQKANSEKGDAGMEQGQIKNALQPEKDENSGTITAEDVVGLAGVSDAKELELRSKHFQEPGPIDGEGGERTPEAGGFYQFYYNGEPYELQIVYENKAGALSYISLQRLSTGEWLNIYQTPEYVKQYGIELAGEMDIRRFFDSHRNMTDYLTYRLPGDLADSGYLAFLGDGGGGNLFLTSEPAQQKRLRDLSRYVDPSAVPEEWRAAGAVQRYVGGSLATRFEKGDLTEIELPWNHTMFLTEPAAVPGCEASALMVLVSHDMYTPASLEDVETEYGPVKEEDQTSRMWYVFFSKPDCNEVYTLSLNADLFDKSDLQKTVKSVHFTDRAWTEDSERTIE